jgi:hypothetical protein
MKKVIIGIALLALVGAGVGTVVWRQGGTPEAQRERLLQEFLLCLPDSLESYHHEEIQGLFDLFWFRADGGLVAQADMDTISTKLQHYVDEGSISGSDLVYFMAQVGYKTYAGEDKYRLPSGEVDHPVLNPQSALIDLMPDTAGFADWLAERERMQKEEEEKQRKSQKQKDP